MLPMVGGAPGAPKEVIMQMRDDQDIQEIMEAAQAEEEARANGGLCDECERFTYRPSCGSCAWRLCEEHDEPRSHGSSCYCYPE